MTQQEKATQDFFDYEESLEKQKHMIEDALKGEKQRESQALLDDFAKAAMQGIVSRYGDYADYSIIAHKAYDIAEALMQERERRMKG